MTKLSMNYVIGIVLVAVIAIGVFSVLVAPSGVKVKDVTKYFSSAESGYGYIVVNSSESYSAAMEKLGIANPPAIEFTPGYYLVLVEAPAGNTVYAEALNSKLEEAVVVLKVVEVSSLDAPAHVEAFEIYSSGFKGNVDLMVAGTEIQSVRLN